MEWVNEDTKGEDEFFSGRIKEKDNIAKGRFDQFGPWMRNLQILPRKQKNEQHIP